MSEQKTMPENVSFDDLIGFDSEKIVTLYADDNPVETRFVVDTDVKAEWAIKKIREIRAERDRLVATCDEQISFYEARRKTFIDRAANDESYFISLLQAYFQTVPHKATKTQEKYILPSADLIARKKPDNYKHEDDDLIRMMYDLEMTQFVDMKPSLKWSELKERVTVDEHGDVWITDAEGEMHKTDYITFVPGATVFEVKV